MVSQHPRMTEEGQRHSFSTSPVSPWHLRLRYVIGLVLAWFTLGALVGTLAGGLLAGRQLERLALEKEELEVERQDLINRLNKLEESARQRWQPVVREVQVEIDWPDPAQALAVRRHAQTLLADLLGMPIQQLHPSLISQILDGRRLPVGETTVELRVRSVYVTEIVTIRLQLIALPKANEPAV